MIDVSRARELLKQAVETQGPDFIYMIMDSYSRKCFYEKVDERHLGDCITPQDSPKRLTGCLVGVALDLAGEDFHHGSTMNITSLALSHTDKITPQAAQYFRQAQNSQDGGSTWGTAYELAETWAEFLLEEETKGQK